MEFLSKTASDELAIARAALAELGPLVDAALVHLNHVCHDESSASASAGLSPALLDEHQLASYDISFCVAEQTASGNLLDYAEEVGAQDELAVWVACRSDQPFA